MTSSVLVVAALRAEVAALVSRLRVDRRGRAGHATFVVGTLDVGLEGARREAVTVAIGWTGDGARAARLGLESLLETVPTRSVLVLGLAGGLSPDLAIGDRVLARRVFDDEGEAPAPRGRWRADATLGRCQAVFLSSSRIAITGDEKRALRDGLANRLVGDDAGPRSTTVDLETASFARVASAHGIEYDAVRVISDTADESLPVDFNRMVDSLGRVRAWQVALWALRNPRAIPALNELKRRLERGAETLAEVGVSWLAAEAA